MKHCWLTQFLKASTEAATILICYLISLANIFVMLSESSQIGHLIPCSEGEVIELSKRPSYNCLIHFYPRGVCQVSCIVYSCLYSGLKRKSTNFSLVTVEHLIQPWKVDTHNCILLFCSIQLQFILFTSLLFKSSKIGEARLVSGDAS
jgi:hypothetical protein